MNPPPANIPPLQPGNSSKPDGSEAVELAELYAAGALTPAEAADFERRMRAGEPSFVAAYASVISAMEALLEVEPVAAPASIRNALQARLIEEEREAAELWDDSSAADAQKLVADSVGAPSTGLTITRATTGRWHRTGVTGVRFRQLHASRKSNRRTIMLDMAPGSSLPDHEHAGDEEVFMISGDLTIAGTTLGPGDYIRIAAGAEHGVPRTTNGCTCIVVSAYIPFPLKSWLGFVWTLFLRPGKSKP